MELLEHSRPVSVFQQLRHEILSTIRKGEDPLPRIQGRSNVKEDVVISLLSGAHPYLVSVEGTGKTRLARSITGLLGPVPKVGGCPYNDDPRWPRERLCPRCRSASDPVKEFGVEWIAGEERFSRIQGNEYTNESKLLGLKDIQAIASGMSPSDPRTFTGTGVFRANRGLLFVDELPAVRTKVQVLLHPIMEEGKAILEEYGWEYPLDLCVLATGNPEGFSHVNEVPRPLIDRFETIYMDLPEEDVEFAIMRSRRSGLPRGGEGGGEEMPVPGQIEIVPRLSHAPWWILRCVNKAARQSRQCRWLERASSIRGTIRAADHAYSSAEMDLRSIVDMRDVSRGLKLALRGRVQLRQDLIDFEDPRATLAKVDELCDDFVYGALGDMAREVASSWEPEGMIREIGRLAVAPQDQWPAFFMEKSGLLRQRLVELERMGEDGNIHDDLDDSHIQALAARDHAVRDEYFSAAGLFMVNLAVVSGWLGPAELEAPYVAREIGWGRESGWS